MTQHKDQGIDRLYTTLTELKFLNEGEEGKFSGYGSVFNIMDEGGDVVVKGAYKASLKEWKKQKKLPKLLVQHGFGETGLPIGKWLSMEEDDHGLKVEGQLFPPETDTMKQIHMAMKAGELDGLSIGYRVKEFAFGTKPGDPRRTLKAVDLFEVSVVTFPMNTSSRVDKIKSITTIREFEKALREEFGFSHARAKAIAEQGFKASQSLDESDVPSKALSLLQSALSTNPK